jgi:hypothetical protein
LFSDAAIDRLFLAGLDAIDRRAASAQGVCSIPIAASAARVPMIVHLLPVCGNAQDIFSAASKLVIITPVDRGAVPNAEVLRGRCVYRKAKPGRSGDEVRQGSV